MTKEEIALWVQVAAVVVAVGASVVALIVSALDRRNARKIAAMDRLTSIRHNRLTFEMEALLRLSQNLQPGGSNDTQKSRDMGAEAGAIVGAIGPERLPKNWEKRIEKSEEELRAFVADESNEGWIRRAVEAQLALMEVTEEIHKLTEEERRQVVG
jgi:hypothetical protein